MERYYQPYNHMSSTDNITPRSTNYYIHTISYLMFSIFLVTTKKLTLIVLSIHPTFVTCSASLSLTQNIILLYRITYIFIVENQLSQFTFRISFLLINLISLLLQTLLQSILATCHCTLKGYILLVDKLRSCFGLLLTIYLPTYLYMKSRQNVCL